MKSSSSSKVHTTSFHHTPDTASPEVEQLSVPLASLPAALSGASIARHEIWRVVPLSPPQIERHCPRCQQKRGFDCSDKFRINGHHKHLDVWLIYKCESCEYTWNYTLYERISPGDIPDGLLPRFERNEQRLAWRYAFDLARLRRFGAGEHRAPAFEVEKDWPLDVEAPLSDAWGIIDINATYPLPVRLGVILARGLARSRSQLTRDVSRGDVLFASERKSPLRRAFSGQERCFVRLREG